MSRESKTYPAQPETQSELELNVAVFECSGDLSFLDGCLVLGREEIVWDTKQEG